MKNKIILILICLCLCGCANYAELDNLSIVTAVAIDKKDDNYEVSFLIANAPKSQTSSKEGEAQTTVYSGEGKTISEAAQTISQVSPKQLYFGHINVVVISEDVGKEGFFKVADFLIRNPESRKKFYLLQAKDTKAQNVLKIVSPLESFPSQSIATLIESNRASKSIATSVSYSNFVGNALEKGNEPVLPSIMIKGDIKEGSSQENLKSTEPEACLVLGPLAVFRRDKLLGFMAKKESRSINILKNDAKEINYTVTFEDKKISIDSRRLITLIKYKGNNTFDVIVSGKGDIYSINNDINIGDYKEIKKIEKVWSKTVKKDLKEVINKMSKKYKSDIFGFGNLIYKEKPDEWKKYEKNWNKKYFGQINVNIKTNLKITSVGSLNKTITEAEK